MDIDWDAVFPSPEQSRANDQARRDAFHKHLADQKQPGYSMPGFEEMSLRALKFSNPELHRRVVAAHINHASEETLAAILRGEA